MSKNLMSKARPVNEPYEVYVYGEWEWRVLKKYQTPENERKNPYARWFCAVRSPYTYDSYDMGDTYVNDVIGRKLTDEERERHLKTHQWRTYP